jgi:cbb3-type cytochrome oxidase maturation protein
MTSLLVLIPVALFLGALGLAAFLWAMKSGQFDDLDGAAARILNDDDEMEDDGAGDVVGTERHKARTADPNMPEENIGTTETP